MEGYSPRGLKESDTSEPLSLPLHIMIFNSKLTVIIKFSLNIQEFLNDRKQDKGTQYISLCYFIVILSVNGSGESSHNGLSEGLRCSLNQPTGTSGGKTTKYQPLLAAKGFLSLHESAKGRGKKTGPATLWSNTATCRPQKPKRRKPGRKVIVPAGFSRRGLDGVDAKSSGRCP